MAQAANETTNDGATNGTANSIAYGTDNAGEVATTTGDVCEESLKWTDLRGCLWLFLCLAIVCAAAGAWLFYAMELMFAAICYSLDKLTPLLLPLWRLLAFAVPNVIFALLFILYLCAVFAAFFLLLLIGFFLSDLLGFPRAKP